MSKLKGVIMAAGYGTRFLPVTKTIPKEMLPIITKPAIDFILDEFEEAGIKDIIIITHRKKKALEDYLDTEVELSSFLKLNKKEKELHSISARDMNFIFIRQKEMKGTGDALLLTQEALGGCPFILAYPDDIVLANSSLSSQMAAIYKKHQGKIKGIMACENFEGDVSRFGVIENNSTPIHEKNLSFIKSIVEKPAKGSEPSHIISIGRYLLTCDIFPIIKKLYKNHKKGEFYLTDSLNELAKKTNIVSYLYEGKRLDVGEPRSYVESLIYYIKNSQEYKDLLL